MRSGRAGPNYGGSTRTPPGESGQKILRAIDILTGDIAWELPQTGPVNSWGGTLATVGGLVFFGEDSGALMAVNAETGAPLWDFQTNAVWKASPMTYIEGLCRPAGDSGDKQCLGSARNQSTTVRGRLQRDGHQRVIGSQEKQLEHFSVAAPSRLNASRS